MGVHRHIHEDVDEAEQKRAGGEKADPRRQQMSLRQGGEQERGQRSRDSERSPGAPDLWRQHAGDRHGGERAHARGQEHHREARIRETEDGLDLGDRDGPGADAEAIGEEDRSDAGAGAHKTVRSSGVHR